MSILYCHQYVIDAHWSHTIEEPVILFHLLQASKVTLLKDLQAS